MSRKLSYNVVQSNSPAHRVKGPGAMAKPTDIGQRIKRRREAKGWGQTELARQIALLTGEGLTSQAVNMWESGKSRTVRPLNLLACADALEVSVRYLVTGEAGRRSELSRAELQLLTLIRKLDADQMQRLVAVIERMVAQVTA